MDSAWGDVSEGKRLTLELTHQSDAIAAFDWLANQPKSVPQLYAYWVLRKLDREHARAHIPDLSHDHRKVASAFGCLGSRYEVRELERVIANWNRPAPGSPAVSDTVLGSDLQ